MQHPHRISRRTLLAGVPALLAAPSFAEAAFPSRPITLICPFTPGGTADVQLRVLAVAASKELGQTVVVDNKGGAAGTIGPSTLKPWPMLIVFVA